MEVKVNAHEEHTVRRPAPLLVGKRQLSHVRGLEANQLAAPPESTQEVSPPAPPLSSHREHSDMTSMEIRAERAVAQRLAREEQTREQGGLRMPETPPCICSPSPLANASPISVPPQSFTPDQRLLRSNHKRHRSRRSGPTISLLNRFEEKSPLPSSSELEEGWRTGGGDSTPGDSHGLSGRGEGPPQLFLSQASRVVENGLAAVELEWEDWQTDAAERCKSVNNAMAKLEKEREEVTAKLAEMKSQQNLLESALSGLRTEVTTHQDIAKELNENLEEVRKQLHGLRLRAQRRAAAQKRRFWFRPAFVTTAQQAKRLLSGAESWVQPVSRAAVLKDARTFVVGSPPLSIAGSDVGDMEGMTANNNDVVLPGRVIDTIFSSLDLGSLARAAVVCKRWHRLMLRSHVWQWKMKSWSQARQAAQQAQGDEEQQFPQRGSTHDHYTLSLTMGKKNKKYTVNVSVATVSNNACKGSHCVEQPPHPSPSKKRDRDRERVVSVVLCELKDEADLDFCQSLVVQNSALAQTKIDSARFLSVLDEASGVKAFLTVAAHRAARELAKEKSTLDTVTQQLSSDELTQMLLVRQREGLVKSLEQQVELNEKLELGWGEKLKETQAALDELEGQRAEPASSVSVQQTQLQELRAHKALLAKEVRSLRQNVALRKEELKANREAYQQQLKKANT